MAQPAKAATIAGQPPKAPAARSGDAAPAAKAGVTAIKPRSVENAEKGKEEKNKDSGPPAVRPANRRKRLLLAFAGLALIAVAIAGSWKLMSGDEPAKPQAARTQQVAQPKPSAPRKPGVFVNLETFSVNLQPSEGAIQDQYLQVGLSLKAGDTEQAEAIKAVGPEVRSRVLILLSSKRAGEISTPEGKQKLAETIQGEVNKIIGAATPDRGVQAVLFTSFVIQ